MTEPQDPLVSGASHPSGQEGADDRAHVPPVPPPAVPGVPEAPGPGYPTAPDAVSHVQPPEAPHEHVPPPDLPPVAPGLPPAPAAGATPKDSPYAHLDDDASPPVGFGAPVAYEVPRHRWVLIAVAVALVCVLLAGGAYAVWRWGAGPAAETPGTGAGAPGSVASSTTASSSPSASSSAGTTSSSGSTSLAAGSGPSGSSGGGSAVITPGVPARAPYVAYRAEGGIWVAAEDGSGRKRVADSPAGSFALSPDGKRVAVVDQSARRMAVINVSTGVSADAGPAEDLPPAWSPDSSFVVFTAQHGGKRMVMRAGRDGGGALALTAGATPKVSPDGTSVYFIQATSPGEAGPLAKTDAKRPGKPVKAIVDAPVYDFTVAPAGVVYVTGASRRSLWRTGLDGTAPAKLMSPPTDAGAYTFARPLVSPDGALVVVDRAGDDGFARMSVLPLAGGSAVDLSPRRDDYPLQWSIDGTRILFITGNAMGDQAVTDLMSVKPDGSGRVVVVPGAGL